MPGSKTCVSSRHQLQQWLVRGTLIACVILAIPRLASAQYEALDSGAAETSETSPRKLEDTVVTDMLTIVDHKFDTLTTRITSLEHAVNKLQFTFLRQFRGLDWTLQEVKKGVESLDDQVGVLEVKSSALQINSGHSRREVKELKSMSEDLASSIKELSNNLSQQDQFMRTLVQDTALTLKQDAKRDLENTLSGMIVTREAKEKKPINCSVEFAPVTDHVDRKLIRLKRDVYTGVSNLLKDHRSATTKKCDEILNRYQTETCRQQKIVESKPEGSDNKDSRKEKVVAITAHIQSKKAKLDRKKAKQSTTADVPPRGIGNLVRGTHQRSSLRSEQSAAESKENVTRPSPGTSSQNENDAMIMEALTNMTTSVQQAVSYFKNTAYTLEVILSNTDMLLHAQNPTQPKPVPLPFQNRKQFSFGRGSFIDDLGRVEAISAFPGPGSRELPRPVDDMATSPQQRDSGAGCSVPDQVIRNIDGLVKNGSQLLELLTDLAEMSSMSMLKATNSLQTQVSSMEHIQSNMGAALSALEKAGSDSSARDEVLKVSNTTRKILRLVETISSNSAWLPLIFREVKRQDAVGNRTLHMVSQNHGLLRRLEQAARQQAKSRESNTGGARSSAGSRLIGLLSRGGDQRGLDEDFLDTIYDTSLQLHRIMPALTKLLAEPDPLFTVVNGGRPDQGRIEIYHRGRWGALCQHNISHDEADVVCRHLGFKGGISAGPGHFGAGAGESWSVNISCLETAQCTSVTLETTSEPCSHDLDAGVICDHMLRIIASDASSDNKTGRLEIHHRGLWLPICNEGWGGRSSRVACQQMGYTDGRQTDIEQWATGTNSTWLSRVSCRGDESRLDACRSSGWRRSCKDLKPAGVRCV